MSTLFAVVMGGVDAWHYVPATQAFGALNSPATRADMIERAAEAFFMHFGASAGAAEVEVDVVSLEEELEELLKAYRGWMARRNGLLPCDGHSEYVVMTWHTDMSLRANDTRVQRSASATCDPDYDLHEQAS
jgi:hypothetical protein